MSLGSNGVDRVLLLRKIPMQLRGTNFCTSSARFAPSFVRQPNCPKCTQMVQNSPKHEFWSNGVDRVLFLRKIPMRHRRTNFCTRSACFAPSFVREPNGTKLSKAWLYGPMGWIRCVCCEKFRCDFVAQTFALFGPFCTEFCKATKRSQMHPNGTKLSKTWV